MKPPAMGVDHRVLPVVKAMRSRVWVSVRTTSASPVPAFGSAKASAGAPSPLVNPDTTSAGVNTAAAPVELVGKTVAEVEKQLIINTLEHCLGNRTHAATILGISIRTLRNKLKAYSDEGLSIPTTEELEEATT